MNNRIKTQLFKMRILALILALCLVPIGFNSSPVMAGDPKIETADEAPPEAAAKPPFDLSDADRIAKGKKQFNQTCAAWCHGKDPVLFIDREGLTEKFVYKTIRDGGVGDKSPMPSWGSTFTSEEIWELVAYIKSIGKW